MVSFGFRWRFLRFLCFVWEVVCLFLVLYFRAEFVILSAFFSAVLGTAGLMCLSAAVIVAYAFLYTTHQPSKQIILTFALACGMLILGIVSCTVIPYNI